jgi:hypothetical protein
VSSSTRDFFHFPFADLQAKTGSFPRRGSVFKGHRAANNSRQILSFGWSFWRAMRLKRVTPAFAVCGSGSS